MSLSLGRLERVPLRTVWGSEAGDFTPWLSQAANLELLGDAIGIELAHEATEQFVGPFRADIVCKDAITDTFVLIENQLEKTDHTHLGQLLTYAAGLNAVTIVWIAERFTDEHRAALDWLNQVTDEHINFFGLEVELWRIGESAHAPKFNVVSQPNDWTRQVAGSRQTFDVSSSHQLKLDFWTEFRKYLEENRSVLKSQKPSIHYSTSFSLGRSGFRLEALVGMRDGYLGVQHVIHGPDAKAHYLLLLQDRVEIEQQIGTPIAWRELSEQNYMTLFQKGIVATDRAQWQNHFAWLRHYLEAFHRVLYSRIRALDAANAVHLMASETDELTSALG